MGKAVDCISPILRDWISQQKLFFVSTAPLSKEGHINCSPKGLDSFRILDENTVMYQDMVGSGAETIAHLKENGRIVIMFCAFDGPPKIVRLYGIGRVVLPNSPEFAEFGEYFKRSLGVRSYIVIKLNRVTESCGYAVPKMNFLEERDVLDKWNEKKGAEGLREYMQANNTQSLDGLPALPVK